MAVLSDGVLQQVGTPDEIYGTPANRFVATFVGSPAMNLLPAKVAGGRLRAGPFDLAPPARIETAEVEVGIRPEHLEIAGEGVPARVTLVEPAGTETYVHVEADGRPLVLRAPPDVRPPVGSTVRLAAARVHVFDARSGAALA